MADHYQPTYSWIRRHITLVIFLVLFIPFLLVVTLVYFTGYQYIKKCISEQAGFTLHDTAVELRSEVDSQITGLIKTLTFIAEAETLDGLRDEENLKNVFARLERESGQVFQDLAVLSSQGEVISSVLPYGMEQFDYSREKWFDRACMDKFIVSDVYPDSRMNPFFVVTARHDRCDDSAILRASVNGLWLSSFVEDVRIGKTGEAFIINRQGAAQTRSRMGKDFGHILDDFPDNLPGANGTQRMVYHDQDMEVLAAITVMKSNDDWFLVVSQEKEEAIESIFMIRLVFTLVVIAGLISIIFIGYLTSNILLRKIRQADEKKCVIDEQLIQSQKLAAIGQLSSGVAHEINNPLAVIGEEAGWLQDLMEKDGADDFKHAEEFRDSLGAITEQVRRCKEITHKLLSFARKMDSYINEVKLQEIIDEVVDMREQDAFLDNIIIEKKYSQNIPKINSEPYLLRQLFLNLLNNALDAVGKDGKVKFTIGMAGKDRVMVRLEDSGVGIPKENLGKIFDPFFTTKPPGKGTGLGLSICHGIITKLGGDIRVESTVGKGTTVTVILPPDPPDNVKARAGEMDDAGIVSGSQTY
ncbi:sensor histidine kinase [Desulfonatronovibrio hydrogenovorans]|uniref:sensor histidine kinase n=1 Tax=Desulfonatronovibrio hydrogenovorans TaxID=53245 RepID=UPI00068DCE1A|nr:PAS domain-containing sensor histidine kinase [Desulfonatronovibrio hydrogenovorans]